MSLALVIAIVLVPGWVYLLAEAVAAVSFARRGLPIPPERPPISVLKPLHGEEPGLYENLRSFVEQDYPTVQIVLGANDTKDGALPVADALIHDIPAADIAIVVGAPVRGSNLKVANLENMLPAARHHILVISDSDMRVDRGLPRDGSPPRSTIHPPVSSPVSTRASRPEASGPSWEHCTLISAFFRAHWWLRRASTRPLRRDNRFAARHPLPNWRVRAGAKRARRRHQRIGEAVREQYVNERGAAAAP